MDDFLLATVLGEQIYFCVDGTTFGDPENSSGRDVLPPPPTVYPDPDGTWLVQGKVTNGTPNIDSNELTASGMGVSLDDTQQVGYEFERFKVATFKYLTFSTQYLSKAALELSFERLVSDKSLFLNGWVYVNVKDTLAAAGTQDVVKMALYGKLSVNTAPNAANEITNAELRFDIVKNPLATFASPVIPS